MPDELDPLSELTRPVAPPRGKRPAGNYVELINRHSARTGLDPDLVRRVVVQESAGKPRARSWAGASGLAQLMPGTAKRYGVRDVNDPDENLRGATDYLKDLSNEFKDPEKVLAAYNAGEGAVRKHGYQRVRQFSNFPKGDPRRGGYAGSTGAYVDKILKGYEVGPQDPLTELTQGQVKQTSPEVDPLTEITSQSPVLTRKPGRFDAMAQAAPVRRRPRAPVGQVEASGLGSVRQLSPSQAKQADEYRVREMTAERSQGTIPRGVDPRLLKGEQPSDPMAYAKAQELVGRVEPQREIGGIRAGATAMGPRDVGVFEQIGEKIKEYAPGIRSLDTPMGIKTDPIRGAASLGLVDFRRTITPEEKIIDPDAEGAAETAYQVGSFAPAVAPYIAAGKVVSKIPSLAAATREAHIARTALTFGGVELGREAIRSAQTGEELNPQEVAISTAIGGGIGALSGVNPSLKREIVAAITPQVIADVARGTDPQTATFNALTNLGFGLHSHYQRKAAESLATPKRGVRGETRSQPASEAVNAREVAPEVRPTKATQPDISVEVSGRISGREQRQGRVHGNERPDISRPELQAGVTPSEAKVETQPTVEKDIAVEKPARTDYRVERPAEAANVGEPRPVASIGETSGQARHVDLQPRRVRGEGRGQFKAESRAERETRRQQVAPPKPAEPLQSQEGVTPREAPSPARVEPVRRVEEVKPPSSTVVRNESLRADRAELGLPELERQTAPKAQEVLDSAVKANASDPRAPDVLVEQALRGGKNWTDTETLQVGLRTQEVKNRIQEVKRELVDATDAEVIKNKSAELDGLVDEYAKIHEASERAGAEWASAGRARQTQISEDFTYEGLVARAKSALKRDLTPEQKEQYRKQADRIVELEQQIAKSNERAANNRIQKEITQIRRQTKRGQTKAVLDEEFASLKSQLVAAKLDIKESGIEYRQGGIGLASLDPSGRLTPIIARMAKNRARAGITSAEKLIDEVYYAVKSRYDVARDDVAEIIRNTLHESNDVLTRWDAARQKRLVDQIMETRTRAVEGDFATRKREPPIYSRETARLQRQIDETKVAFNREMYRATRSMGGKISDELTKAANVPKTIKSMGDISAVFRQGGFYAITHPVKGLALPFRDMVRSFNDAGYRNVVSAIKNHPKFGQSVRDGVEYTGVDKADPNLSKREEGYLGSEYLDYIPVAKQIKEFSERTFVSFLDSQRLNMYDTLTDGLASPSRVSRLMGARTGLKRTELAADRKRIAKAINSATGRGNLGASGNQIAPVLNIAMFSPRLLKSRVELLNNMFNPVAWANMPRNARAQILQDNVKFIGATIGVLTLAKALGAEVNYDPDDSDFLKIRVGNTTYDTLTGLQQPLRFLLNMKEAVQADVTGDETYAGKSKGELVSRFARSKLSPSAGTAVSYVTGKDFMGEKFNAKREAVDLVTPLPASDVIEAFKQDGIIGVAKSTPALVGIGVGTYPQSPEKPTTRAEKLMRKMIRENMPDDARTAEEIEKSKKVSELRARSRRGEDVSKELPPLLLSRRQEKAIEDAKGRTRPQEDFNRLSLRNAIIAYGTMTRGEQESVRPILLQKTTRLDDLPEGEQAEVKKRLEAIGMKPGIVPRGARPPRLTRDKPRGNPRAGYVFQ